MFRVLMMALVLAGCGSDGGGDKNNPGDDDDDNTVLPTADVQIDAVPRLLEFLPGELAEAQDDFFTVLNKGGNKLVVSGLTFSGDAFSLVDNFDETFELGPGEIKYVDIHFVVGSVEDVGTVVIHSNDPVNPELTVDLLGHGLVPHLTLTARCVRLRRARCAVLRRGRRHPREHGHQTADHHELRLHVLERRPQARRPHRDPTTERAQPG